MKKIQILNAVIIFVLLIIAPIDESNIFISLIISSISVILAGTGAVLNIVVMKNNGGKMPVLVRNLEEGTKIVHSPSKRHFFIYDLKDKSIKLLALIDRYRVYIKTPRFMLKREEREGYICTIHNLSLGDLFIIAGIIGIYISFLISFLI